MNLLAKTLAKNLVPTPESLWDQLFEALRNTRKPIAIVVTGGGTGALSRCFRREGASSNFVEAVVPYSHTALAEYLQGAPIDASASDATASQLASEALRRARRLVNESMDIRQAAGIALSAALPTTPARRGQDRIHVALAMEHQRIAWSLELVKDRHSRESAETIADEMIFAALTELCHPKETNHLRNQRFFADAGLDVVCVRLAD